MVLDGVVAPDLTPEELNLGQAKGFERATRQWAAYCVEQGDCPLGESVDEVMKGLRTFLASVDAEPAAAHRRQRRAPAHRGLGLARHRRGDVRPGRVAAPSPTPCATPSGGDGTALMQLADQYADRNPGGQYAGNIMEVIYAVNCLDKPDSNDLAERDAPGARSRSKDAPTWGPFLMWSSLPCGFWPVKATGAPEKIIGGRARPRSSSSAPPATRPRPTSGRCGCATSSPTPR